MVWNLFLPTQLETSSNNSAINTTELTQYNANGKIKDATQSDSEVEKPQQNRSVNTAANGNTTLTGVPNAPKPDVPLRGPASSTSEKNVSTWKEFQDAVVNRRVTTIYVQANIYNTTNTRAVSVTPKNLTIHGNGYYIDFRDTSFEIRGTLAVNSNFSLKLNHLTMYGYNYYGPFSIWSKPSRGSNITSEFNNITYVGTQLMASWDWDINLSGKIENHSVNSYISPYNGVLQKGNTNQVNLEATNLSIANNASYNGSTENAGVIYLSNNGKMKIGNNAEVTLKAGRNINDSYAGEFSDYALYLEGTLEMGVNSKLTITARPTGDQHAIYINGSKNGFIANKGAEITLNGIGPSGDKGLLDMQNDTVLQIEDEATLNLISKNKGDGPASLLKVGDNGEFIIGKRGSLNAQSDGEGQQNILYFGDASTFRFADAKSVNIQYTNDKVSNDSSLFRMYGSKGKLEVDIQSVQAWDKSSISNNDLRTPDFTWNPMFNMITNFNYAESTARTGQTIYQNIYDSYMKNFIPENFSRLLYTSIEDISLEFQQEVNDTSDSTTLKGKTNPGAFVRITGDPALPKPSINSNIIGSTNTEITDDYTVIADDDGNFEVSTKNGQPLTATNTIKVFAFKNGRNAVEERIVLDKTAPTAEGKNLVIVRNDALPAAKDFMLHAKDSNPFNKEIKYTFKENYSPLTAIEGTHKIIVTLTDSAGNSRDIGAELRVENTRKSILADNFTVKLSELRTQKDANQLQEFILKQSNTYAFEIANYEKNDLTSLVTIKNASNIEQLKKGKYDITLQLIHSGTLTHKFTVTVLDDEAVSPTAPENPGASKPAEKENEGTGQKGLLKLDYIPSSFDFGVIMYGFNPVTVHANKTASHLQWLQVSDNRDDKDITSWGVYVSEDGPLTNSTGEQLTGSAITIPKGRVYNETTGNQEIQTDALVSNRIEIETSPQKVFSAPNKEEKLRNISTNVWNATDVQLTIPGGKDYSNTEYSNTINWTLVAEPDE